MYVSDYIYIYMALGPFAAAKNAIFHFFPSFIVKNGQKEMLQICPVSLHPFLSP